MHVIRNERPVKEVVLIKLAAIVLALILSGILIVIATGLNPLEVYSSMVKGSFGSSKRLFNVLRDTAFLWLIAIGLSPAFRMRFWNTGAEGQILMGGLLSAAVMIYLGEKLPNAIVLILMFFAAILGGMLWGFIPAYFNVKYRTNETLFTLMMNYIAMQIVEYMVDVWDKKQSHCVGIINASSQGGWLPKIFNNSYLCIYLIVVVIAIFMYIYLNDTKHGYEIDVVGGSENTALYAGIAVKKVRMRTVILSSCICAIAGFLQTSGISHTIALNTSGGMGFTAIIVAWLGKFSVPLMGLMSFLVSFLDKGANQIASQFNFNEYGADIVVGIILFFIIGAEFFCNYKIVFKKGEK